MSRRRELLALIVALAINALAFLLIGLGKRGAVDIAGLRLAVYLAMIFVALHLVIKWRVPEAEQVFLPVVALLSGLGAAAVYRIDPALGRAQVVWVAIGATAAVLAIILIRRYVELKRYKYTFALAGLALLLAPIFLGRDHYGAKLWLQLGPLSFQPAELAKVFMVVFFAAYLEEKRELLSVSTKRFMGVWIPEIKHLGPLVMMWVVSLAVLVFERDLGTSLLFFGAFLIMLYVATGRPVYTLIGSLLFLAGAAAAYSLFWHVKVRVDIWLNPWVDPKGVGYQLIQSLIAISSGGLTGAGLGRGYPDFIPAVHTDFIFSAIAEELGLVGALAILLAYIILMARGFKTALASSEDFGKLLAAGLTGVFALQAAIIIAGISRVIPLTGITLPFVSYGGSSILANFILVSVIVEISSSRRPA
ncbi:MAG: FtsW/RodA/SpoVE family cell cycle protein [Actinobacteria bacterium]|nr:FtsW/RodA/SpoVE family cell cycle protein [Actinomycetota bacterium]